MASLRLSKFSVKIVRHTNGNSYREWLWKKRLLEAWSCSSLLERVAAFSLRFSKTRANEADCADSLRDNGAAHGSEYEAQGELHEARRGQRRLVFAEF